MNEEEAINLIWNQMDDYVEDDVWAGLIEKYMPSHPYVFKMSDFDTFCQEHFPGQYLKVAMLVSEASEYYDFCQRDDWVLWDPSNKEIKSICEPLHLVEEIYPFIKNLVLANDPVLIPLHVEDAIQVIRGEGHATQ